MTLIESEAVAFHESLLWPDGPRCPECGTGKVYAIAANKATRVREGLYGCGKCGRQFSSRGGTPLQGYRVSIGKHYQAALWSIETGNPSGMALKVALRIGSYATACKIHKAMPDLLDWIARQAAANSRTAETIRLAFCRAWPEHSDESALDRIRGVPLWQAALWQPGKVMGIKYGPDWRTAVVAMPETAAGLANDSVNSSRKLTAIQAMQIFKFASFADAETSAGG